jgi:glutamate-1-semialdehyde 2,1-aminomutase
VLGLLDAGAYDALEAKARRLEVGVTDAVASSGMPAEVPRAWTLCGLFFAAEPVTDYDRAQAADAKRYGRFFQAMLRRGVFLPPSPFETWFPSLAHTDADLEATVQAARDAAAEVASSD